MKSVCDNDKPNNEYALDKLVKIANGIFFHNDSINILYPKGPQLIGPYGIGQIFKNPIITYNL